MYGLDSTSDMYPEIDDGFFFQAAETASERHQDNNLAWMDFAMKTEAELLNTMVLNKTCVPSLHNQPETENPEPEDWHWIPVNEPSSTEPVPVPGFSEESEWNKK